MKKFVILLCTVLVMGGGIFLISKFTPSKKEEPVNYSEIYNVGELPLTVDLVPLTYQLEEVEGQKVLNVSYTNNSSEAIMTFFVNLQLKSDQEPVNVKFSQLLQQGETSTVSKINVPADTTVEEIKAVKYMISLQRGIYMEYDANTNQYNWS